MTADSIVFEERKTVLKRGAFREYYRQRREGIITKLRECEADVICILSGLIGHFPQELFEITRFPDASAWRECQKILVGSNRDLVESESVRLLRAITSRPKASALPEDARPLYVYRQFFVRPQDIEEFADLSENGVWPRFDAHEANILGLWTPLAETETQEILLITGYHSMAHWEATRVGQNKPEGFDEELWEQGAQAVLKRHELTLNTRSFMMRPNYIMGRD
jgi:hypothetical protein